MHFAAAHLFLHLLSHASVFILLSSEMNVCREYLSDVFVPYIGLYIKENIR